MGVLLDEVFVRTASSGRKDTATTRFLVRFALGFHEEARTSRPPTASGKMLNTLNITKFLRRGSIFRTGGFSRGATSSPQFRSRKRTLSCRIDVNLDLMKPEGPAKSRSVSRSRRTMQQERTGLRRMPRHSLLIFRCSAGPGDSPGRLFPVHGRRSLPVLVTDPGQAVAHRAPQLPRGGARQNLVLPILKAGG